MSMDLTGITNRNEYYTNHYLSSVFEENAQDTISNWRTQAKDSEDIRTPWALLREAAKQYYPIHDRFLRSKFDSQTLANIQSMADTYLNALGYENPSPQLIDIGEDSKAPVYLELNKSNGAPALWVMLAASNDKEESILEKRSFLPRQNGDEDTVATADCLTEIANEQLITKIFFEQQQPPRFILLIGMNQIALIDRNKWNEKRYMQFELEEIFSRREESTLQAMAVLLHRNSLCPKQGGALIDELGANSEKHAAGVSQDLKYALRECIELLGNEVLYDLENRLGRDLDAQPVDATQLTIECLRYMYRMLFVLFIEARSELGYAPIKAQSYLTGYSLESLRDIASDIRDDVSEVGGGYYLHETLSKLYDLIYYGYPETQEEVLKYSQEKSLHDMFVISPLKAHIFDPQYTKMLGEAKLRNSVMLRIIDLMSLTRGSGRRGERRGRISYANLGINQLGSVYEALLSYRGFIAQQTLFEVKRAGDNFNELDVGYFVAENELDQYTEDERARYEQDDPNGKYKKGQLRKYEKGSFIYRLAGREREKSASYYTPEALTKCLVKYALNELLEGKTADEILQLTVCEPAMGSAAFLNEAINQLGEAYLDKKQKELNELIPAEERMSELQKVKMYIADRNIYGIDLNPVAVELAEVSLWLNTIHEGGFVPWFGTQLAAGNSLIGARRQCYGESYLSATSAGMRWYENEPERVKLGTPRKTKGGASQIYHFLLGDPGMCAYSDKVIEGLEPEKIKAIKDWKRKFTAPYTKDEIQTLRRLSQIIDELWERQIEQRKIVKQSTRDALSIYGHSDAEQDSHTTIRQKDYIYSEFYKSEHAKNALPYARLKFAMDYWCSLWFWNIENAELLPTRAEFLTHMNLILQGVIPINGANSFKERQLSLFPTLQDEMAEKIMRIYPDKDEVDIDNLCELFPPLRLAREIAQKNRFMHWELEFADLFLERDGFDLIIGNPPWVKLTWEEKGVLSDAQPMFAVKNLTATQTTKERGEALKKERARQLYFDEYQSMAGQQSFLNAAQNYSELKGQQSNLYKCFLPQAWRFNGKLGVSAFVHPEGVYDSSKGSALREILYSRLRKHFMFENKKKLFAEVDSNKTFSLNVYGSLQTVSFDTISNLFDPTTIAECYEGDSKKELCGIKDEKGNRNTAGHPDRVIKITKKELSAFAKLFADSEDWKGAPLPALYSKQLSAVLKKFLNVSLKLGDYGKNLLTSEMWHETNAQKDGTIKRHVHFPHDLSDTIYSGPHIGVANPLFKTSQRVCKVKSDFDNIDLTQIPEDYIQRVNYSPSCDISDYWSRVPTTSNGEPTTRHYRLIVREMLNITGERTLIGAVVPPKTAHVNTFRGIDLANTRDLMLVTGLFASLPYDFFIKVLGKSHFQDSTIKIMPVPKTIYDREIIARALLLNCLTDNYSALWKQNFDPEFNKMGWSKQDSRLDDKRFTGATDVWDWDTPLRTDFERRQALVELDVLAAMALGMTLDELKTIYKIQFYVLQQNEADTWHDANGRIAFTNNGSLKNVGFKRAEFEKGIKGAAAGAKFYRTITDDTMPGGAVERTIEYVAPFTRCDREKDFERAWEFFEQKYGK